MSEPTLQDCINYMRSQIKQMEKHPRNYEFNLPYYRKTVELLEKTDRPHGEWIDVPKYKGYYVCSKCLERLDGDFERFEQWEMIKDNFCRVCGSDNRPKEGEEE